jgi:hypothetical protein
VKSYIVTNIHDKARTIGKLVNMRHFAPAAKKGVIPHASGTTLGHKVDFCLIGRQHGAQADALLAARQRHEGEAARPAELCAEGRLQLAVEDEEEV